MEKFLMENYELTLVRGLIYFSGGQIVLMGVKFYFTRGSKLL
jgi:hypothetical protein